MRQRKRIREHRGNWRNTTHSICLEQREQLAKSFIGSRGIVFANGHGYQRLHGFNVTIWHGLYAPKGTPKAVTDKINTALRAALKDADFVKREEALGAVVISDARLGGAEHKKFVEAEIAKWGPIIKAAGQYAD